MSRLARAVHTSSWFLFGFLFGSLSRFLSGFLLSGSLSRFLSMAAHARLLVQLRISFGFSFGSFVDVSRLALVGTHIFFVSTVKACLFGWLVSPRSHLFTV